MTEILGETISRPRIAAAHQLIRPHIRRTPVMELDSGDFGLPPFRMIFKLELFQHSGSFKARGAFANLLMRNIPPVGVVAASGGNHGAAVAYAAMKTGTPAKIFVPTISSPAKVQRIREYGADPVVAGERYADALAASEHWIARTGALRSMRSIRRRPCSARGPSASNSGRRPPASIPSSSRSAEAD